ncbi:MAG: DUF839 domain-containing protein, partial [Alphaproteobacteria bacterium]|nr:DUF839 domain-containing protein [Alphaproteobacteria bacterium]
MPETDFAPLDDGENDGVNPSTEPAIGEIIVRRLSRRELLRGVAAVAAAAPSGRMLLEAAPAAAQAHGPGSTTFREIAHGMDERDHLPPGYAAKVLLRWGDPLAPDAPRFDAVRQSAAAQERQFGYNCDYVGFLPLPAGSRSSDHGLLFVNHEYTIPNLMVPGLDAGRGSALEVSREQTEIELAAHGASVVEVRRERGAWSVVQGPRNRRITATTPVGVSGPAAGHPRLRTAADPTGRAVVGMLNNCAGGETPWGTILTCEENFNLYFGGAGGDGPDAAMLKRYGIGARSAYGWARHHARFD